MKSPLAAIIESPERVKDLSRDEIAGLLAQLGALETTLAAQLVVCCSQDSGPAGELQADRLLNVAQAAAKLGISADYLYRHAGKLPFTVRVGRRLRFSELGIERYIRHKAGR